MNSGAERFNGLMAMIGIVAGVGASQLLDRSFQAFSKRLNN
tara:strand:- start:507 stop:629 length:123 start_codon:yes stop_codon:yes gene_type:complete